MLEPITNAASKRLQNAATGELGVKMLITEVLLEVLLEANMKQLCTSGKHVRVIYTPYPHFYIVKLGLQGYTLFLIFALKHRS